MPGAQTTASCKDSRDNGAATRARLVNKMAENYRSRLITEGVQRSPNRSMLRAVGFKDEDFKKPIVGVANSYSTITPCNLGLNLLAQRAERAVASAGAMPQVFGTITVSDGISMGTEGMKYSLVSREVIADWILKPPAMPSRWTGSWRSAAAIKTCLGR